MAESSDCMPEAQLRITVQPCTRSPHPRRNARSLPMLTSSGAGAAQPRITSSRWEGENGWRSNKLRPACNARSHAEKGPGAPRALRKGVRAPSMRKICLTPAKGCPIHFGSVGDFDRWSTGPQSPESIYPKSTSHPDIHNGRLQRHFSYRPPQAH